MQAASRREHLPDLDHTMTAPPEHPKIYHITHVDNLEAIVASGGLVSDAEMLRRGGPEQSIGMSEIKRRRVEVLDVP